MFAHNLTEKKQESTYHMLRVFIPETDYHFSGPARERKKSFITEIKPTIKTKKPQSFTFSMYDIFIAKDPAFVKTLENMNFDEIKPTNNTLVAGTSLNTEFNFLTFFEMAGMTEMSKEPIKRIAAILKNPQVDKTFIQTHCSSLRNSVAEKRVREKIKTIFECINSQAPEPKRARLL